MMEIRILTPDDAQDFFEIRLRALREHPESFGATPEDWEKKPIEDVQRQLDNLPNDPHFGAFLGDDLVGIARWTRSANAKTYHRSMITGMYVAPEARGRGAGKALLEAIIRYARKQDGVEDVLLAVTVGNAPASNLYTAMGFTRWGVDPRFLKIEDRYYDLEWMILSLKDLS